MPGPLAWLDPKVERYLLVEDGEMLRDEVMRHWASRVWPTLRLAVGVWFFAGAFVFRSWFFWVVLVLSLLVIAQALWSLADQYRDRFVVTNQKVYRVHGNIDQVRASVPLTRILDITVDRPALGRLLGFGHFVFESAAQDQGLREIKWVPQIDERERLIQRVIHEAGLGTGPTTSASSGDDGT
ncbi:MAG: PH domain-containing protein [Microlunatus sp.]|nr:PH domain-containing protein [Microlunatus sp.]MDN5769705.1 PH domain-containing protein [Microlunatus sp.]MDN5804145.1 PH domain-containing protein [Microlunatus sp.]